jgi:ABC-type phosphate transport system ATPase subunit
MKPVLNKDYDPKYVDEINEFRRELGMKEIWRKVIDCLHCQKEFISFGPQQRLCHLCRIRETERY